jgi:NADH:ubiquinone oxidoreductase subunit 3 (subunit A)
MGDETCYYHMDKLAVAKCQECGKYICVDCRQKLLVGTAQYHVEKELCPECNVVETKKQFDKGKFYGIALLFASITLIMTLITSIGMGWQGFLISFPLSFIIFGLTLIYLFNYYFNKGKQEMEKAIKIKENALSVKNPKNIKLQLIEQYCRFCGSKIENDVKTCNKCGISWK